MKKIILVGLLVLLNIGCAEEKNKPFRGSRMAIPEDKKDKVAKFICDCTKAGMPNGSFQGHSPEDVVTKCKDTAFEIYAVPQLGTWYRKYSDGYLEAFVPDQK